jgi:hypothetical protein
VVLALDHHFVVVFVVAVDEEGEELRSVISEEFCAGGSFQGFKLTNVTKNVRVAIIASAQLALSIAHVLLTLTDHGLLLWRP